MGLLVDYEGAPSVDDNGKQIGIMAVGIDTVDIVRA